MNLNKILGLRMNVILDSSYYYIPEIIDKFEKGKLILNPGFQRDFKWDKAQKSNFIESILLGLPSPSIFVFEDSDLKWEVIDGQQRLSTILEFYKKLPPIKGNKSISTGLVSTPILGNEFSGKTIVDFDPSLGKFFSKTKIHIFIIKKNSDEDVKYKLFERLNKMGTILKPQEIRNSYLQGYARNFYSLIESITQDINFKTTARITPSNISHSKDKEYVLKILTLFYFGNSIDKYSNLNIFLDDNLGKVIEKYKNKMSSIQDQLLKIFEKLNNILGRNAFISSSKNSFVVPVYDTILLGAMNNYDNFILMSDNDVEAEIINLRTNPHYESEITSGPSTISKIKTAVEFGKDLFK